jgi:cell division protease FtsH
MAKATARKKAAEPTLYARLRDHFGRPPVDLPVLQQRFANYERPNLQLALDEMLPVDKLKPVSLGVVSRDWEEPSLARLARADTAKAFHEGPVEYVDVELAHGQQLACVRKCLLLFRVEKQPVAVLIHVPRHSRSDSIEFEIMGATREIAESFLRRLVRETRHGRAFRGQVLSIEQSCYGELSVKFNRLPRIDRENIILPESLLVRIERHTISFSRQAAKLRAAKRHLKRGILLYGPPGTGKTLSAMYLASQMPERTVLLLTGQAVGAIKTACDLARMLEPATVILEDADLIGSERGHQTVGANALLFELLNEMDGLAEDADVLFVLTTNRPDILEPALSSRPGRIDQAIEVPPPDAECRRRLIEFYGQGLDLRIADLEGVVARIDGVSAAFIRELLRRAAVYAAETQDDGQPLRVDDSHIRESLTELLVAGGPLTRSLLASREATG